MKNEKLFISTSISIFITFTVLSFGVIDIYASNINEFWFSIYDIIPWCFILNIIFALIFSFCLYLAPERIHRYLVSAIFGLGLAVYLQGNWLLVNYGLLNGNDVNWSDYTTYGIINSFIWFACVFIPVFFVKVKANVLKIYRYVSMFIIGVELLTILALTISTGFFRNNNANYTITDKNLLNFSTEKNIVLFVVDECDAAMMNNVIEKSPEYTEELKGFTYFNNASGLFPWTITAMADIITGIPYDNSSSYREYIDNSYKNSKLLNKLQENDYAIGLYTGMKPAVSSQATYIDNLDLSKEKIGDITGLLKTYYQLVAYKYAPHYLKPCFWLSSQNFEEYKKISKNGESSAYSSGDNLVFYERYCNKEFTLTENKTYKVIHLFGCHGPRILNEKIQNDENGTTAEQALKGSLNILFTFMDQMKKQGVFDNSYIIIMGDHGSYGKRQNPVLMVKPFGNNKPFSISNAPVSYADIPGTVLNALTQDNSYHSVFVVKEGVERERHFNYHDWVSSNSIEKILSVTDYLVGPQASETDAMTAKNISYDQKTLDKMQLLEGHDKFNAADKDYQLGSRITKITLSAQKDAAFIYGWAVLPGIPSEKCNIYLGFENGNQEKIYSTASIEGSEKAVDINGETLKIYKMGSFVLRIPLDEFYDADYTLNIYLENSGKVSKEAKPFILRKSSEKLRLLLPGTIFSTDDKHLHTINLKKDVTIDEEVYISADHITSISFRTVTWKREYKEQDFFTLEIFEKDSMEKIFEKEINMSDVKDNQLYTVDLQDLKVVKDKWYKIRFTTDKADEKESIALMQSEAKDLSVSGCFINNEQTNTDICLEILAN